MSKCDIKLNSPDGNQQRAKHWENVLLYGECRDCGLSSWSNCRKCGIEVKAEADVNGVNYLCRNCV